MFDDDEPDDFLDDDVAEAVIDPLKGVETVKLHPELKAAMVSGRLGKSVHHPLIISALYTPYLNAHLNSILEFKKKAIKQALLVEDYEHYVQLHERPYRLEAFEKVEPRLDDETYWSLLGFIWTDSENISEELSSWQRLLTADRPERHCMMRSVADRELYQSLPDDEPITIWRGTTDVEDRAGYSWTMDLERALWFAKRNAMLHGGERVLLKAIIPKSRIVAAFARRGESEVVVLDGLREVQRLYEPFSI